MKKSLSVFVLMLFFAVLNCNALNVKGYVIKQNNDTIYGTIQLPKFNLATGTYYIKGYDEEYITRRIKFKPDESKKYRTYTTDSISGYAFVYHSHVYEYKKFMLEYKSIYSKGNKEYRFLCLIYCGRLKLYTNVKFLNIAINKSIPTDYPLFNEYYLFDEQTGLVRVEDTDKVKSVQDLLSRFNVSPGFLITLPQNMKFKNILTVLEKYDEWMSVNDK